MRAIATKQFGCPASTVYEYGASSEVEPCGRFTLDTYLLWVCGRCIAYEWQKRGGWSVSDRRRPSPDGTCS